MVSGFNLSDFAVIFIYYYYVLMSIVTKIFSVESSHTVDVMVKLMRKTGMRVDKQRWQKFLLKATGKQDPQLAMAISANGFDGLSYIKKLKTFKVCVIRQFTFHHIWFHHV